MPASAGLWQARLFSVSVLRRWAIAPTSGELCLLDHLATARRIFQPSPARTLSPAN